MLSCRALHDLWHSYTPVVVYIHLWLRIYTCGLYTNLFIIKHGYCGERYGVYSKYTTPDLEGFGPDGLAALSILLAVTRGKCS